MLFVVQVMVGKEMGMLELCRKCLDVSSYTELFVPRYVAKRRYQGAWHDVLKELFPGYIFIASDGVKDVHRQILHLPKTFLTGDYELLPVGSEEEMFFRSLLDESYVIRMSQGLIIEKEIWITSGVLKQHKDKIRKIDRHKRVAILSAHLLGREVTMEAGLEVIQKISASDFEKWKKEKKKNGADRDTDSRQGIVLIKSGLFEGLEGKVIFRKDGMVTVGVPMMGSEAEIELEQEKVEHI